MDLAPLGFSVDSNPLLKATDTLDKLGKAAEGAAAGVDKFDKETKEAATATGSMQSAIDRLLGPLSSMKSLLGGMFAGFSIKVLGDMADNWSDLSARVGVATGDMEGASAVMDRLTTTARLTYSSLGQTAEGFVRNSTVLQALGKTTEQQIQYTEALNLALVASGTKGQQALSVQEALSKGMTNGKLATEQLQTVLNGSSEVSKALAAELGTTVLGLSSLATQGKITGDVIFNTLTKRLDEFTTKAEKMPATLGDGFLLLGNSLTALVGSLDQAAGITSTLAGYMVTLSDGILWLSQNTETLIPIIYAAGIALTLTFGPTLIAMLKNAAFWIGTQMVISVKALTAALLANPIGIIAAGIALVLVYMVDWQVAIQRLIELWGSLYELVGRVSDAMGFTTGMGDKGMEIYINAKDAAADLIGSAEEIKQKVLGGFNQGGTDAANKIAEGMSKGAKAASQDFGAASKNAAQAAVAEYEKMNGKLGEIIVKSHETGAEYIYNAYTGAVKESLPAVREAGEQGGAKAGQQIEQAMGRGSLGAGDTIYDALARGAGVWVNAANQFADSIIYMMIRLDMQAKLAETRLTDAQAQLAYQQAQSELQNRAGGARSGSGSGSGYGGGSGAGAGGTSFGSSMIRSGASIGGFNLAPRALQGFANGGQFTVGGSGGTDSQGVAFRATPGERVTVETPEQQRRNEPVVHVTSVNVFDPKNLVEAMNTSDGRQAFLNFARANRDELSTILGY